jgi:HlyD family secretion protein
MAPGISRQTKRKPWFRRLLVIIAMCGLGGAAAVQYGAFAESEVAPTMTHTIQRTDLVVTITEQGLVESSVNYEIKSKVRGWNTVLWIVDSGTFVEKGDELVRLDSSFIQEQIDERTKYANWSQSSADRSAASVARAELAVNEYGKGRYVAQEMTMEKNLVVAESTLRGAQDRLKHARAMAKSEYVSELDVEEKEFTVRQAALNVELARTRLNVLKNFTHKEQMQTLSGDLKSMTANHKANAERATADASRRDRARIELPHCAITAARSGLVIHPNAAKWESRPIAEGTNVHRDQVLLLMPDLSKMQVKVGIHEAVVKRVKTGQQAQVALADGELVGTVSEVATITKPAGWWTANEVRYDTLIKLPPQKGLRPGMSAEVEIVLAEHHDVLTIPVASIVENGDNHHCWVSTKTGVKQRAITLGDSNDIFTVVEKGLQEGDEVLLNPSFYEGTSATEGEQNE